ncbi:hypothetical protein [Shewanella sp. yb_14]|uniref:hypothetical protein n=1 Tax=Shewanella TaxID=22 RepID=UPI00370A3605
MKVTNNNALSFSYAIIVFLFSVIVFEFFTLGDQYHYSKYYLELKDYEDILMAFLMYTRALSTTEPGYFIVTYISSKYLYLDKYLLVSLINSILAFVVCSLLLRVRVNRFLVFFLIFFNFYLFVLYFSAERLKFALLFFAIAIYIEKGKLAYFLMAVSILFHSQMILFVYCYFILNFNVGNYLRYSNKSDLVIKFFLLMLLIVVFLYMFPHIQNKLAGYSAINMSFDELIKPAVFGFLILYYSGFKQVKWFFLVLPFLVVSYFTGGERLVFILYFFLVYLLVKNKRELTPLNLLLTAYFSYKGIGFIYNIFAYGDGFNSAGITSF